MSNKEKTKQLKMSNGKARNRLGKMIMFDFVKKCKLDKCYHCKEKIEKIEHLSIEHKIPWLHSEDPAELYFNLDNIAFSHLSCNCRNSRNPNQKYFNEEDRKNAYAAHSRNYRARLKARDPEFAKEKRS